MCGIAGIVYFTENRVRQAEILSMTNTLEHRGPDGEGTWISETATVGFGHRRLSIIDLSDAGRQPMQYAQNRFTITYNGEIYNYLELRDFLISKNYRFISQSDTEVILAAFHYWGKDCLQQFDGMFAFAIWDEFEQKLFCARDRFGEKPLYFYKDNDRFFFASEMKAIFSLGVKKEINRKSVFEYLLFLTTENPFVPSQTFYTTISQLPASSYLVVSIDGQMKFQKYWDIDTTTRFKGTDKQAYETFGSLFNHSIQTRMRSDVPIGSSLSGGLDSSAIVCIVNKILKKDTEQHVFSARFPGFVKDEGVYISEVHKQCTHAGIVQHEAFPSDESMLNNLDRIMYYQEQPFGSASIAAQYEVMKLAAENNIRVLLDGQGADELLSGYSLFFESYLKQLLVRNPMRYTTEKNKLTEINGHQPNLFNFTDLFSAFFPKSYKKIGNQRRKMLTNNHALFHGIHAELVEEFKSVSNPVFSSPDLKAHLKFMMLSRGLNELLRYADRNAMAHSVEVRLPFLNHRLVEFVFSLPESYFIRDGWTKFILRKSMENILPTAIQWRKDKIGYEPPQAEWMKNRRLIEMTKSAQEKLMKDKILSYQESIKPNWHHLMLGMLYD